MTKNDLLAKLKIFFKWIMPEAAIILVALIVDLVSKAIVADTMRLGQTIVLIPKLLNISFTVNPRAAFGSDFGLSKIFGENGVMIFFIVLTFIAVGFFGFLLFKKPKKGMLYRIAFSLVIAGALGNLYDRIFLDGVRDFIQFEYLGLTIFGSKTFAIFNIADSCVVVGVILLIVYILFFDKTLKEDKTVKSEDAKEATPPAALSERENPEEVDSERSEEDGEPVQPLSERENPEEVDSERSEEDGASVQTLSESESSNEVDSEHTDNEDR